MPAMSGLAETFSGTEELQQFLAGWMVAGDEPQVFLD